MDLLDTQINPADAEFRGNASRMESLVAELRAQLTQARAGGGERYLQRHREQGKLPARERISRLLDPGSPLLELSAMAAWDMYDNEAPGAGLVTVIETVPGVVRSVAGIVAVRCKASTYVVGRACPFHCTADPRTNCDPVMLNVKGGTPAATLEGDIEPRAGAGLVIVRI